MSDIDGAETILVVGTDPLHSMPILDLRLRKAMRDHGTRVAVVSERPTALDGGSEETLRYAPGEAATVLSNLAAELASSAGGAGGEDSERIAGALRPGKTVVIYGERIGHGPDGERALAALIACADALNLSADGAGLLEVPETCNARGLREVGCLPTAGPGLSETAQGMSATQVRDALEADELDALILWDVDPIRELPDPERWRTALGAADFVLEVGMFGNASGGQADVFLPGESHAEKEGTVTHPDGRVQRVRPSVPHPGDTRHGWQWLAELAFRLGHETGVDSSTEALEALVAEVPFYAGLTHEEIGGTGVRWQEREQASSFPTPTSALGEGASGSPAERKTTSPATIAETDHAPREESGAGGPEAHSQTLRLGTYRDLWAYEVTERSPALRFLMPGQTLELSIADAERFGVAQGDPVNVRSNGHSVKAKVAIRERIRPGSGFLIDGLAEQGPNALAGAQTVEVERIEADPGTPGREAEEVAG